MLLLGSGAVRSILLSSFFFKSIEGLRYDCLLFWKLGLSPSRNCVHGRVLTN